LCIISSVIIESVNCRELAGKIKIRDNFSICKERYDITDTHCFLENESQWRGECGYIGKFGSYSSRCRGVVVLFKNSFEFRINSEILDTNGNVVILDITIQDYRLTLVAIYGPNDDNPDFFQSLQSKICLDENTSVIIVSDWNVVQNYDKHTINYQFENNRRAQVKVHQMMDDLDLIDIWRVASEIGIIYRSGHSPVCMKLKFINQTRGRGAWKFSSLLTDTEFVNKEFFLLTSATQSAAYPLA
jgi:hypothetical protein